MRVDDERPDMTRFDAATPTDRRKLFADAIVAHRERGSAFCTFQAESPADRGNADADATGDGDDVDGAEEMPPWLQFGDRTLNLDCTDAELDRLKELLGEFPAFKIEQLESPEEAEGTNVRINAKADPNRIAQFVERTFREVYDRPAEYVAWAVEV